MESYPCHIRKEQIKEKRESAKSKIENTLKDEEDMNFLMSSPSGLCSNFTKLVRFQLVAIFFKYLPGLISLPYSTFPIAILEMKITLPGVNSILDSIEKVSVILEIYLK